MSAEWEDFRASMAEALDDRHVKLAALALRTELSMREMYEERQAKARIELLRKLARVETTDWRPVK